MLAGCHHTTPASKWKPSNDRVWCVRSPPSVLRWNHCYSAYAIASTGEFLLVRDRMASESIHRPEIVARDLTDAGDEMETQDYPTIQRDQLCLRCRAIDVDDLFDIKRLGEGELGLCRLKRENAFVMGLESSAAALRNSVCLLCKLFGFTVSWGPHARFKNSASNITCHIYVHIGLRYLPIKARDASNP
jgi:hypothetical protein